MLAPFTATNAAFHTALSLFLSGCGVLQVGTGVGFRRQEDFAFFFSFSLPANVIRSDSGLVGVRECRQSGVNRVGISVGVGTLPGGGG